MLVLFSLFAVPKDSAVFHLSSAMLEGTSCLYLLLFLWLANIMEFSTIGLVEIRVRAMW
jgi:hypothetical protein